MITRAWGVAVALATGMVVFAPVDVTAHEPGKALVGSCTTTNTSGIVKLEAEVVNGTAEVLKNIRPGEMFASGTGNASILFQAFPRAVRDLLPNKTARLTWKGRVFGDGYLDLSTEVIGDSSSGLVNSGIINCNRIAVGNPDSEEPPTPTPHDPGEPTARPTNTARATPTQALDTPTRTVRPTSTIRPTRTRVPTSTQRPTRTPLPTYTQRPTRTPIGAGPTREVRRPTRTRRPTSTRRPTRTPLVSRATRTPVPARATRTRVPTPTRRPTRTPLLARATATHRPTRTPIGFGQATPTPTSHGSGGGTPGPNYNPNGLIAQCSLRRTIDLVTITMLVQNNTGADIRGLAGSSLDLAPEGGALFFDRTGPNPDTYSLVRSGFSVSFQWSGRLTPGGTMGFAAYAAGFGPDDREVRTLLTNCGSATGENGSVDISQFTGRCGIDGGDSGRVNVTVSNHSGASLTDVVPRLRSRNTTGSVQIFNLSGPVPGSSRRLPNGQSATYAWRARILGVGTVTMQFEVTALRSNGLQATTGLFECDAQLSGGGSLPDLSIDEDELRRSAHVTNENFGRNHCAVVEGCLGGTGARRLLRFSTRTPNYGPGDVFVGDPAGNDSFIFSECHAHFHFVEYADYRLLDLNGNLVARGHKQAFCLIDLDRVAGVPGPASPQYPDCGYQGISAGWADVYHSGLDCQWVDITGVPEGRYVLEVSVNPARVIQEGNYSNNTARAEVFIPRQ